MRSPVFNHASTVYWNTRKYGPIASVQTFPHGADPERPDTTPSFSLQGWGHDLTEFPVPNLGDTIANQYAQEIADQRFGNDQQARRALMQRYLAGGFSFSNPQFRQSPPIQFHHELFMLNIAPQTLTEILDTVSDARSVRTNFFEKNRGKTTQDHKDAVTQYLLEQFPFWKIGTWEYEEDVNVRVTKHVDRSKIRNLGTRTTYVIEKGWSRENNSGPDGTRRNVGIDSETAIIETWDYDVPPTKQSRMPYVVAAGLALVAAGLYVGMCSSDNKPADAEPRPNIQSMIEDCASSQDCRDAIGDWARRGKEAYLGRVEEEKTPEPAEPRPNIQSMIKDCASSQDCRDAIGDWAERSRKLYFEKMKEE